MSRTEARQHFGSVHIFWHGRDHCWDASPGRRRYQVHRVRRVREVQQKIDPPIREVQQKIEPPQWYQSMSQMLPDEEPVTTPWVDRWVTIEPPSKRPVVDITGSTAAATFEQSPEPMLTPRTVVVAVFAIALTLAMVELVSGGLRWTGHTHRRH